MISYGLISSFFPTTFLPLGDEALETKKGKFPSGDDAVFPKRDISQLGDEALETKNANFLRAMRLFFSQEAFRHRAMRLWETKYANFSQANSLFFVSNLFGWANKPKLRSKDACRFGEMSVGCPLVLFRLREKGKHTVTTCLHREGIKVERTKTIAG